MINIIKFKELEDEQDDIDSDAQDYANLLKEINDGDTDWEGETGLGLYSVTNIINDLYNIY